MYRFMYRLLCFMYYFFISIISISVYFVVLLFVRPSSFMFGRSIPLLIQRFLYSVQSKMRRNRRLSGSWRWSRLCNSTSPARFLFVAFISFDALSFHLKNKRWIQTQLYNSTWISTTVCTEYQFKCKDGTCLDSRRRCDARYDCPDESDEEDCGKFSFPYLCLVIFQSYNDAHTIHHPYTKY